jgi:sugar transferase (PEP-CTERM/EpsH1 system associated)
VRILYLTHRLPYAPNRGDRVRAFHMLRVLARTHEVHLVSLVHDREEESHAAGMLGLVSSVTTAMVPRALNLVRAAAALAGNRPLTHVLLDSPQLGAILERVAVEVPLDVVLAYCSGMAQFALRPPLVTYPFLLDMVDVDSEKWTALAAAAARPRRWVYEREAGRLRSFEATAARKAAASLVVNEREAASLRVIAGDARIEVIRNGVQLADLRPPADRIESADVVFCGIMNYGPNERGALWLAQEVWPLVRRDRPDARLLLVGSGPTRALRNLPTRDSSIVVTGRVPDVRPFLWRAAVSAAPLWTARGVQNKVLEAVASGLPSVVTPVVAAGLPAEVLPACRVTETPEAFASALIELLQAKPEARRGIAARADLSTLSWERCLAPVSTLLAAAAKSRGASGPGPVERRITET